MKILREWKQDEIEFLFACIENNWLYKDIANELGRTVRSISHKASRLSFRKYEKLTNKIVDEKLIGRNIKRIDSYLNNKTKIEFLCLNCTTSWKATPSQLLNAGTGCPSCAGNISLTNKIVDKRLERRTIRRIGNYINNHTKIEFLCLNCNNNWKSIPKDIFRDHGCPLCAISSFNKDIPAVTYCIYFKDLDIYKVGISNSYINRLKDFGYKPEIIFLRHFDIGIGALDLEAQWLQNIKDYKINTGLLKSGNTETFKL